MNNWTLIRRSLVHYARAHLGVLLGAAVGSAVLVGALLVGDSVRASLRAMALNRLGQTEMALASNDRLFRSALAEDVRDGLSDASSQPILAPALQLLGTASSGGGAARANRVQVLGVDDRFWQLAPLKPEFADPSSGQVVLNAALAQQLKVAAGDSILLRVSRPSQLSRDAPLAPEEGASVALRVTVQAVARDDEFGRFSLQANQVPPFNAYLELEWFQNQLELEGRANLLLAGPSRGERGDRTPAEASGISLERLTATVRERWQLADADLVLRELKDRGALELRSGRVFLDAPIVRAALDAHPQAQGILTYFVNALRRNTEATPYSMVSALGAPIVPPEMADDEILINQWTADDLQVAVGDPLELSYFIVGTGRKLETRTNQFRVRGIVPLAGPAADRELMPDFPGMTDAENCRDWDTGFPIELDAIRDQDEAYWDTFRGTPKAFVTLAAGQQMWTNRFGDLTAVRYPLSEGAAETIGQAIRERLDPASVGLAFQPVRQMALAASEQALDFGQLFLGFSFFLIVAALLLMALLFQFGIEQRATEVGTLLALGFTPGRVRRLLLGEGAAVALAGGLLGMAGGIFYARAMLLGLSTIWREAVGTSALQFHATGATLVIGALASITVAVLTIWLALRKQMEQPARELLAEGAVEDRAPRSAGAGDAGQSALLLMTFTLMGALLLVGWGAMQGDTMSPGPFFGAGALLLIGLLAFTSVGLSGLQHAVAGAALKLSGMGLRNATRRRKRSLATVAMLACGSFLVVAVGANRLDPTRDAERRSSGTGGFALVGESALAVVQDLNAEAGRDFFGLDEAELADVSFVPFRLREGDDASCLNLNRAQTPRVLGVNAAQLQAREAFTFAQVAGGFSPESGWELLNAPLEDSVVPGIADQASIVWALGKKVGDVIRYTDERGRTFQVKLVAGLANSILQGSVIIAEEQFVRRFPSESGYRMFLIDAPSNDLSAISSTLSRALQDVGLELIPALRRLAAFNAVQNTYLATFQVLGGLGLLLGSVGLGVVVLRNVLERRGELALLLALGFRPRAVHWLVVSEHGALLVLGLAGGVGAAAIAVLPALLSPGAEVPYGSLAATLAAVFISGALWTWICARLAVRGRLLAALRND